MANVREKHLLQLHLRTQRGGLIKIMVYAVRGKSDRLTLHVARVRNGNLECWRKDGGVEEDE